MRIGIVGAENSHCAHIAKSLNVEKDVPGVEVTHVWGETPEFAAKVAEEGSIPNIVADHTDMIGRVDGIVVDHRDGKHHLPAARPFVEAGIPVFVDKPFCTDLREGIEFARFARDKGVPVTSYSVLSLQQSALSFAEEMSKLAPLRSLVTAGPVDIDSEHSGVFFYAVHQVDLICSLVDDRPSQVAALRRGGDGAAVITFDPGPVAIVNCLRDWWAAGFVATAYSDEGVHHSPLPFDDKMYLSGIRRFCDMFATGQEPAPPAAYLRPVAILHAMQESFDSGRPAEVQPIPEI
ncbi:MAG: Gfo/Idh/MocA family oxidoreductase [Armatimonadota bacterium]|nr:MAG: Gfo/Idh/MocA family oxidoreductase [Armatimonadota bacterium]